MSQGRFNLSALAVRERAITLFLILLISLGGVMAFFKLGRAEDPSFTIKVMTIITAWPGATAQEMQDEFYQARKKVGDEGRNLPTGVMGPFVSVEWLVAARVLQAMGAALLTPASLSLVLAAFPINKRALAVSLWGAVAVRLPVTSVVFYS